MTPHDVEAMPVGMRATFTRYQNAWITEQNNQGKKRR